MYVYCLQFRVNTVPVFTIHTPVRCSMHIAYIYLNNNQYTSREMCAYKTLMNVYGSFFFLLLVHSHFFICVSLESYEKNLVLYFSETFLFNRWIALVAKTCNRYSRCSACPAFLFFHYLFLFLFCNASCIIDICVVRFNLQIFINV